ncbi:hypothetical protein BJ170DRAFT_575676 [Xylariales sp. AK1849]|nr:hypothetical protein BJ170DRAFT_575676 [Xylariales sp. AK1849]
MADPHTPTIGGAEADADALLLTPTTTSNRDVAPLKCCCGSVECLFLRHNCSVLDNVEKDVHTAARMGQALLARHEAYMADAERDRMELTGRIEQLEMNNKELEEKNARTIEENRSLLDELEMLNTTVNDTEGRIKSLEATLLSSQQIIRRLEGETARAASLERQLAFLEEEQADLQNNLAKTQEEGRSAISRWQRAERGINNLQEQLESMEREAREEREKHAEMIGRMEKQREVEKELNTAAGRLKGAAAAKTLDGGKHGSDVVSHFVRDLLQDNANLQHGIAELREMLMNSNDEIQALREQLMYHQPLGEGEASPASTLRAELEANVTPERDNLPTVSQELHIHHHYHVATKQEAKKPRKKRQVLSAGVFIPPAQHFSPPTPPNTSWRPMGASRAPPKESVMSNRWSVMSEQPSEFAPSSVPSSPQSNPRNSLFDPAVIDSYPTSPTTSIDPMSPTWRASHRKHPSNMSARSFLVPTGFSLDPAPTHTHTHTIIEEGDGMEDVPDLGITTDADIEIYLDDNDDHRRTPGRLRRALSHESIMSLSGGLDIHTLKVRPSQLTLRHLGNAASITASSTVTARPMLSRDSATTSSALLRDKYSHSSIGSLRSVSGPAQPQVGYSKLSSWVGWRPWSGGASAASTPAKPREKDFYKDYGRTPGINQPGAIPGFHQYWAAHQKSPPAKVMPDAVDHNALREGLME